jgi:hypothetical protein
MTGALTAHDELQGLEDRIAEVKKRLPAHSVQPSIMAELLELEDRRDRLLKQLQCGRAKPKRPPAAG